MLAVTSPPKLFMKKYRHLTIFKAIKDILHICISYDGLFYLRPGDNRYMSNALHWN